ncbi:hypothetical protein [Luteibacter jiangsuensis]|jgi:hypothetical protein
MNIFIARSIVRTVALASIVCAAGCQGTLHTRFVQASDTYDFWSLRMTGLPIRLHRPDDAPVVQTRDGHPSPAAGVTGLPRIELYVGGTEKPVLASVCAATTSMQADTVAGRRTLVVAALCDGPRLVAAAEDHLEPEQAVPALPLFRKMAHRLLHAIDISAAQTPVEQYG